MGSYNRHIKPRFINCVCGMSEFSDQRQKIVPAAQGLVVEVGIGFTVQAGDVVTLTTANDLARAWGYLVDA